ncbi:hypothetical protein OF83DRAFT_36866 [Amylostereum chailletii]|nr:hypothetical protein OF83DRAFT_36866 [Amylostereum chailletii]
MPLTLQGDEPYHDIADNDSEELDASTAFLPSHVSTAPVRRRRRYLWTSTGIVGVIVFITAVYTLWSWSEEAVAPAIDGMPVFSTSLGCNDAPFLYQNQTVNTFHLYPTSRTFHHELDIKGSAVGTITLAEGRPDAVDIEMDLSIRADDSDLAQHILLKLPDYVPGGVLTNSHSILWTPNAEYLDGRCMRYDIVLRIPPSLRSLTMRVYTLTHVVFDPSANIHLEDLSITSWSAEDGNMLLPHTSVRATRAEFETRGGWIVGEVPVEHHANVLGRGQTTTDIVVKPVPNFEGPVGLQTILEHGRMDILYEHPHGGPHRTIRSKHDSDVMSNMFLTYKNSGFGGNLSVDAMEAHAEGVHGVTVDDVSKWTDLWVGSRDGPDEVIVRTPAGWVGLFF